MGEPVHNSAFSLMIEGTERADAIRKRWENAIAAVPNSNAAWQRVVLCDLSVVSDVRAQHKVAVVVADDENQCLVALAAGAHDAVTTDCTDTELRAAALRISHHIAMAQLPARSKTAALGGIIGDSEPMRDVYSMIERVAPHPATVLVVGDSGTGKELVARAIHDYSPRKDEPFIAVNCGAIPENLLESELFGHKKGAFTDASRDKKGLIAEADHGTLFLDEIGELPAPLQAKLLRVLQESEIRPIGSTQSQKVDVRIIAATLRDLEQEAAAGRFREDLFYRLNVLQVKLPPLAERTEDIPLLVDFFLKKAAARQGESPKKITVGAMDTLQAHTWPGNVRELQNAIERAVVMNGGDIIDHVQLTKMRAPVAKTEGVVPQSLNLKNEMPLFEKYLVQEALRSTKGDKREAAKRLGITSRTLLTKMREYKIEAIS